MRNVLILGCNRPVNIGKLINQAIQNNADRIFVHLDYPSVPKYSKTILANFSELIEKYSNLEKIEFWTEDHNIGAAKSITTSISRAFEHSEYLLILEDDLVVSDNFFQMGWDILDKFQGDINFSGFAGFNPFVENQNSSELYLSNIFQTWGWGTWRNNWKDFMVVRDNWTQSKEIFDLLQLNTWVSKKQQFFWRRKLHEIEQMPNHIWDYQWLIHNLIKGKITVYPPENLVVNIGFDDVSTIKSRKRRLYQSKLTENEFNFPDRYLINKIFIDDLIMEKYYRVGAIWPINEHFRQFVKKFLLKLKI
jgi:hypothetical protein